jgi:hypothetical protein
MRAAVLALALALGALGTGCRHTLPAQPLAAADPRPQALLDAWRAQADGREALRAVARLAVDAPGAGVGGRDLSLRSKQRLWLARPASLRVEVLGFLDTALAVLTTDGVDFAWLQSDERRFDTGPVYEALLWDAARLDLTPDEAVEVILGAPRPDADLRVGAAFEQGERVRIELADATGRVRRVVEFDADGQLRRLEQRDAAGRRLWEVRFGDYVDLAGGRFARDVSLRDGAGGGRADLTLRDVELNPPLAPGLFQLRDPAFAPAPAEDG